MESRSSGVRAGTPEWKDVVLSDHMLVKYWEYVVQWRREQQCLHGVDKYAADVYAIFCVCKPEDVVPSDHMLVKYWDYVVQWRREQQCQGNGGRPLLLMSMSGVDFRRLRHTSVDNGEMNQVEASARKASLGIPWRF
ncbi:hypothetical protein KSP40_PGU008656 [Platanthera guangdongensis]|uniref:Uncharacterized protein n=1 Tax=Platanthera guangdongensis TaxID=2320717 RepID=A0ABR2LHQ9_9ASPA